MRQSPTPSRQKSSTASRCMNSKATLRSLGMRDVELRKRLQRTNHELPAFSTNSGLISAAGLCRSAIRRDNGATETSHCLSTACSSTVKVNGSTSLRARTSKNPNILLFSRPQRFPPLTARWKPPKNGTNSRLRWCRRSARHLTTTSSRPSKIGWLLRF